MTSSRSWSGPWAPSRSKTGPDKPERESLTGPPTQPPAEPSSARAKLKQALKLQQAGRRLEAAQIYSALVQEDPGNASAWHLLGTIEIEQGELSSAQALIAKALTLRADTAVFHHNLAFVMGALGRSEEALSHYRRAVELRPDYAEAYFNLSGSMRVTPDDPIIPAVEALLAKGGLSAPDRCFLLFAAGKIYDDIGDYDRAFDLYRKANTAKKAKANPAYGAAFMRDIINGCGVELFAAQGQSGSDSERPVFVVGMARSGTSLVEQILASHPQAFGAGELPDIDSIAKELPNHAPGRPPYPACLASARQPAIRGLAEAYLKRLHGMAPDAARVVDKAPLNFRHLGLIALMFPRAKIIHCRRNALDTCLSCYFQNFASGQEYSFDMAELGRFYRGYHRMMDHWRQVLPVPLFELRYEDLIAGPEQVSRRLVDFCGLDWDPACLAFHQTDRRVQTASRWQVRQPVYSTSVRRWKRYDRHLGPLRAALGPLADEP